MKVARLSGSAGIVLATALAGCRSGRHTSTLSVIPRDVSASSTSEHAGVAEEAAKHGLAVYWNGSSYADEVDEQVSLVERAIRTRSYGLIISPNNPYALNAGLERALAGGMPVVVLGSPIPLRQVPGLSMVLGDRRQATDDAASLLAQELPPGSEVMIVASDQLSPGNHDKAALFADALHRLAPGLSLVEQEPAPSSSGGAELITERAIRAHPRLRAIFALDSATTNGVLATLADMGQTGKIHLIGCDQTMNLLYVLRQHQIDALVVLDMPRMAALAVQEIVAERNGQTVPPRLSVPGLLVTNANVNDQAVQQMLRMDWRTIK